MYVCVCVCMHIHIFIQMCNIQRCTDSQRQDARANKYCVEAYYICGFSVWSLLHVTFLALRFLRWVLKFWKICGPLCIYSRSLLSHKRIFCVVINKCSYNRGLNFCGQQWRICWYHRISDTLSDVSYKPRSL